MFFNFRYHSIIFNQINQIQLFQDLSDVSGPRCFLILLVASKHHPLVAGVPGQTAGGAIIEVTVPMGMRAWGPGDHGSIPSLKLTYPIPRHCWVDDFPFPQVGYVSFLEGIYHDSFCFGATCACWGCWSQLIFQVFHWAIFKERTWTLFFFAKILGPRLAKRLRCKVLLAGGEGCWFPNFRPRCSSYAPRNWIFRCILQKTTVRGDF